MYSLDDELNVSVWYKKTKFLKSNKSLLLFFHWEVYKLSTTDFLWKSDPGTVLPLSLVEETGLPVSSRC